MGVIDHNTALRTVARSALVIRIDNAIELACAVIGSRRGVLVEGMEDMADLMAINSIDLVGAPAVGLPHHLCVGATQIGISNSAIGHTVRRALSLWIIDHETTERMIGSGRLALVVVECVQVYELAGGIVAKVVHVLVDPQMVLTAGVKNWFVARVC